MVDSVHAPVEKSHRPNNTTLEFCSAEHPLSRSEVAFTETTSPPFDFEHIGLLWSLWDRHATDPSAEPSTISTGQENHQDYLVSAPLFFKKDIKSNGPLGEETDSVAQNTHEGLNELTQNTEDRATETHQPGVEPARNDSDSM